MLGAYSFTETLHGPNGEDRCVDCGVTTYSVRVPEGRDIGPSRCSKHGRAYFGVDVPPPVVPAASMSGDLTARIAWQARRDSIGVPAPLPTPVYDSRDVWPVGVAVPGGAATLRTFAQAQGWDVRLTYACGPWLASRGAPLRRCVLVRCRRDELFAIATYVSPVGTDKWTFVSSLVAGGPTGIWPRCNVTALKAYLITGTVAL
jgi:hypothetical protein